MVFFSLFRATYIRWPFVILNVSVERRNENAGVKIEDSLTLLCLLSQSQSNWYQIYHSVLNRKLLV